MRAASRTGTKAGRVSARPRRESLHTDRIVILKPACNRLGQACHFTMKTNSCYRAKKPAWATTEKGRWVTFERPSLATRCKPSPLSNANSRAAQQQTLVLTAASVQAHRITSSACSSIDCGIVIPSALAVLRLTTNSNFVGCSIGRSPGLAPFRILSTYPAARRSWST